MAKNIGILTFAVSKAGVVPLSNLVAILRSTHDDLSLITDNEGYDHFKKDTAIKTINIKHKSYPNGFINMLNYIHKQLLISAIILTSLGHVGTWVFFFNAETMVIPLITLKLTGKKVILSLPSSSEKIHAQSNKMQAFIMRSLSRISYRLVDNIVVYSPALIKEWNLSEYHQKIRIAHEHIIDFKEFKQETRVDDRPNLIGYIGRLDAEKGVMNLVGAIPEILVEYPDARFLIIGDGNQASMVREYVREHRLEKSVEILGWVPHGELPVFLNRMKLLVIPSYTEGLPNTMLEAMACGTPVLANSVGSIPDFIVDGQSGFIMGDNSPECIARHIKRILNRGDMENICINGEKTVEAEFAYEATVKMYLQAIRA